MGFGFGVNLFQFFFYDFLFGFVFVCFLCYVFGFGFQLIGIVVFMWQVVVMFQFKDSGGDVVKEIVVVGDCQDCVFIGDQVFLQSGDGFGVKVVGWFV